MRAIIPCAGYGTRMGMRPDQSKEMIIFEDQPLIDFALDECLFNGFNPLIITREEKADLINYCAGKAAIQLIEPKGEWYETVLKSKVLWEDNNVLILPDTRFSPKDILNTIRKDLEHGLNASIGVHWVKDGQNWGTIKNGSICEKDPMTKNAWAWGLIGFEKDYGVELFESMREKKPFQLINTSYTVIDKFEDVTRG